MVIQTIYKEFIMKDLFTAISFPIGILAILFSTATFSSNVDVATYYLLCGFMIMWLGRDIQK